MNDIRFDWTREQALELLNSPLAALLKRAVRVHETYADSDIQQCELLSVKTGNCPEDCGYCSQSAHYKTEIKPDNLMDPNVVVECARKAKESGATRFCMGAAWRDIPNDKRFDSVLKMIEGVSSLGVEVCCTMGMASEDQLVRMKEAGLTVYNHNLDTSREFYPNVITSRTYDDRIQTLQAARRAGVGLCCGGILGLGESVADRAGMLADLANFKPHPESVPINLLVPIEGTPLKTVSSVPFEEFLRTVATARIMMPSSRVRLSAGRNTLTEEQQMQCFKAGANSIFVGEKLLTAPNVDWGRDQAMLASVSSPS